MIIIPCKCTICQGTFKRSTNLKRQQLIHTGERPFGCNRTFRQKVNLKLHKYQQDALYKEQSMLRERLIALHQGHHVFSYLSCTYYSIVAIQIHCRSSRLSFWKYINYVGPTYQYLIHPYQPTLLYHYNTCIFCLCVLHVIHCCYVLLCIVMYCLVLVVLLYRSMFLVNHTYIVPINLESWILSSPDWWATRQMCTKEGLGLVHHDNINIGVNNNTTYILHSLMNKCDCWIFDHHTNCPTECNVP